MSKYTTHFSQNTALLRLGFFFLISLLYAALNCVAEEEKPNILWISIEDTSPDMGCYGDKYADTPNIDRLAEEGVRYDQAIAHAGVCAPARSGIITGMYPSSIGTNPMRCSGLPPAEVKCFSEYLRKNGYYCTNNWKTDYQFSPPLSAWDENGRSAHWRNCPKGKPFFSIINLTTSHESWVRARYKDLKHDPKKANLPPYIPDTEIARRDWARYYDTVTETDKTVGKLLKELEKAGLSDNTIVWFWGDHGRGLPRAKRWLYDSGVRVPLIVRVPKRFRTLANPENPNALAPGSVNKDLVSFIDFAPTMLNLAGIKIPEHFHGRPFLGPNRGEPQKYVYGARDRVDEAVDNIRMVRGKRFKYLRNFMPHRSYSVDIDYQNQTPMQSEMRRLHKKGKLSDSELLFFQERKPIEELYDTQNDPHEVNNLAGDKQYASVVKEMREALYAWMEDTQDIGLIPEPIFDKIAQPNGVQFNKVKKPVITRKLKKGKHAESITLDSETKGASICYLKTAKGAKKTKRQKWELYTKPIELKSGETIEAKACRIGYRDSDTLMHKFGQKLPKDSKELTRRDPSNWKDELLKGTLLDKLLALKKWDGKGSEAIPHYIEAVDHKDPSIRYWAIVGLQDSCKTPEEIGAAKAVLYKHLKDPSPIVTIAAAEAFCHWGQADKAIPVLKDLAQSTVDNEQTYALTALYELGPVARPAISIVKEIYKSQELRQYGWRISKYILNNLDEPLPVVKRKYPQKSSLK